MKKKLLALAFCLPLGLTQAQNMLTNGGFESYNTLPTTCPTLPSSNASTISDVNSWSGSTYNWHWDPINGCVANTCTSTAVYGRTYYYNSTTGGNGSCEPFAANSGTGYVVLQSRGAYVTDPFACHNGVDDYIYQSLSGTTLYASNNYTFQGYVYLDANAGFGSTYLNAYLTTGTTIPNGSGTSISVTGSGWVSFSVTLNVPSNGSSYNLVVGASSPFSCLPVNAYFYFALDDLSLTQAPCVGGAGSNKSNTTGCCSPCPGTGVQIGTAALSGLSYSWSCSPSTCYISNSSVAQPTVSPCYTTTPTTYSVSVSGPGCNTQTYTMTVTTSQYSGASCCRLANPDAPEKGNVNKPTHFTIFPNPASSEVTLSLNKSLDHLKIIDASGRVVYETRDVAAGDLKLDVSRYAKGVYFVIGKTGDDTEKQKFIVE